MALNVPIGQRHAAHALESGSVIMEVKDRPYEAYKGGGCVGGVGVGLEIDQGFKEL